MGRMEEKHALELVLSRVARLPDGEKLRVMADVDDTTAGTAPMVHKRLLEIEGIDLSNRGKTFYVKGVNLPTYIRSYEDAWIHHWNEIKPLLSHDSAKLLSENTQFGFVSARHKKTAEALYKWVDENYHGLEIGVTIVNPEPFSMHGVSKLRLKPHVLFDDSPNVSESMNGNVANGKVLLLMDRWEESIAMRNVSNTAVVENVEAAASTVLRALDVQPLKRKEYVLNRKRIANL